jgi:hypothetical protein
MALVSTVTNDFCNRSTLCPKYAAELRADVLSALTLSAQRFAIARQALA